MDIQRKGFIVVQMNESILGHLILFYWMIKISAYLEILELDNIVC